MKKKIDYTYICECMKNRYPFLMIDGLEEVDPLKSAHGYKLFSNNEYFWQGHFVDDPNVPGAIQLESMIETFIMSFLIDERYKGMQTADSKISELCFFRKIKPSERLDCFATLDSIRRGVAKGSVIGYVNNEKACSCSLTVCIPELMIFR